MFPAGFCSMASTKRFVVQFGGEWWARACPPLTPRSRRARTKPLISAGRPAVVDIGFPPYRLNAMLLIHTVRRAALYSPSHEGRQILQTLIWRAGVDYLRDHVRCRGIF